MAVDIKGIEVTPEMSAYAIFDKLVEGLSMIDMISTAELECLRSMLTHYKWTHEIERSVVTSMLAYVNSELVADKMNDAAKVGT